ncbi:CsbD family protein [Enterococcus sp. AZ072]|uniref:CsbD family protein n=1 Tax=unclassified Enterococcus TaxID=2608891 RepID=UPI003D268CB4
MTNKEEIKGKLNEAKGKATGDNKDELKGKIQQGMGKAKEKAEDTADDAAGKMNKKIDEHKEKE